MIRTDKYKETVNDWNYDVSSTLISHPDWDCVVYTQCNNNEVLGLNKVIFEGETGCPVVVAHVCPLTILVSTCLAG